MSDNSRANIALPGNFLYGEVHPATTPGPTTPAPCLGPLAAFAGNWVGNGFNTIFRPDNTVTPTPLPFPIPNSDNILELNLTSESLSFSPSLGAVPNRGTTPQGDVFLNGVPYLQTINDITIPGQSTGIHVEPGLWMIVPPTTVPKEGVTIFRMGSIPHGTTIEAQGTSSETDGPPIIPPVDITPFVTNSNPRNFIRFPSQTASDPKTPRIPQDLTGYIALGTITQAMLDDPNTLLRNHISGQNIVHTTTIVISTNPDLPLFGGGTDNIAFLLGQPSASKPNAQALQMTAIFWIETVEEEIVLPACQGGQLSYPIKCRASVAGQMAPTFRAKPPYELKEPRKITVRFPQIQYTQVVMLNFNGLTWPHVSVNTLVPADDMEVPASAWA